MTREEFAGCMAYLSAAVQKPIGKDSVEVYYDLLQDLDLAVLQAACKRVALSHVWATFPSVAEVRQAATDVLQGDVPCAAEAWRLAQAVARSYDPEIVGEYTRRGKTYPCQLAALLDGLPLPVVEAITAFGVLRLVGNERRGVLSAQFHVCYEQLTSSARKQALMPEPIREGIAAPRRPVIAGILQGIGVMK